MPKRASSSSTSVARSSKKTKTDTPPPTHTLVIDNGGDTVRFGWSTDETPRSIPNVTARLPQQWTILAGDQLAQVQNPNSLIGVTRSTERGIIVNWGNQIQVWKRVLDLMGIAVQPTETAQALGWRKSTSSTIPAASCAVRLTVPPQCPRNVLDQLLQIWLEDLGVGHLSLVMPSTTVTNAYETTCLVDLGWSATTIQCRHRTKVHSIRRLPLAGRHLIRLLQYHCSFRHMNLMDQEWLLRKVLQQAGFVSMEFEQDMKIARLLPGGRRPYDRIVTLPDFSTSFEVKVEKPPTLQENEHGDEGEEDDDDDDEDVNEEDMQEGDDNESGSDSDDEAALRKKLVQQRQEAARRIEEEPQILPLSVERFAIPEALFRPSDVGLPAEWAGIPEAIVQAIEATPEALQPAFYRSIVLVGGLSLLPNLKDRIARDFRTLAPTEYETIIEIAEKPMEQAWQAARMQKEVVSMRRSDWEENKRGAWQCFLDAGQLI